VCERGNCIRVPHGPGSPRAVDQAGSFATVARVFCRRPRSQQERRRPLLGEAIQAEMSAVPAGKEVIGRHRERDRLPRIPLDPDDCSSLLKLESERILQFLSLF
jgi:hypothetical protein